MNLFSIKQKVSIIEINEADVRTKSDNFKMLQQLIIKHEPNYPEIDKWFAGKVCNGIINGERKAWIGLADEKPIASSVIKHGQYSKFCHLHIEHDKRHQHLGDIFFSLMALEVKRLSKDVYFTLPEGLWAEKKNFFESFGFNSVNKFNTQYRRGEEELICQTTFQNLWRNVINKLSEIQQLYTADISNPINGILMSIQPNYVEKIMKGEKRVEIRTKFDRKWKGHQATIYSTSPSKNIAGFAKISDVVEDNPENIWEKFQWSIGCDKDDFFEYTRKHSKIYAIVLDNIEPFINPINISSLNGLLQSNLKAPQSYSIINNSKDWKNAMSLTQMVNKNYEASFQVY